MIIYGHQKGKSNFLAANKNSYEIISFLGSGTFGQVTKCVDVLTMEEVAIKILKNKRNYYYQGLTEVKIMLKVCISGLKTIIVK